MEVKNPLYQNQGIHVITSIFTIEKGITKVLLIRKTEEPFKDMWSLVGGALYNNEDLIEGAKREIYEKTGIDDIEVYLSDVFGDRERSSGMRMIAIAYFGVINSKRARELNDKVEHTKNLEWFPIENIPKMAYDHREQLLKSLECLKEKISYTSIMKALFPNGFTIPELQKAYETILEKTFDRRNFRKKLLSSGLIEETNLTTKFEGNKPANVYKFKKGIKKQNLF
ncbi:MAG TPA: hypothetical protein DCY94_05340 [Firmicutes bacterium]|nr:hypothetical protein [Bacillota bacterium]